ncbi:YrhK-like protein [Kushneria avicenniae]|uniref:YrhK-like protein n=1 Tax=Kushneria avicenniae TaxID=402385 RepID=A0A1I1JRQ8_9GAMM|nr:YrhK family protein [Kushneria avicenniae]SFC48553.1 YrhK-like protein [Kushneria avicenniae]
MPHLFTDRPRSARPGRGKSDLKKDYRWEGINAVLYELGGVMFIVGSVMFYPRLEHYRDIGAWLFFVGSLVYLVVQAHDVIEVRRFWNKSKKVSPSQLLEVISLVVYIVGTVLYAVGSLLFLSWWDWIEIGAWMFIVGSVLFLIGACLNVMMVIRASALLTLQLMNLTAVTFVVGSVLFVVASIPYLWGFDSTADHDQLHNLLASLFLVGSAFFMVGGLFNHQRARIVIRHRFDATAEDSEADERLLAFMRGELNDPEHNLDDDFDYEDKSTVKPAEPA